MSDPFDSFDEDSFDEEGEELPEKPLELAQGFWYWLKYPFKLANAWHHVAMLKWKNTMLEQEVSALAKGFVSQHRVMPGDVMVFVTGHKDAKKRAGVGQTFGFGWGALKNIESRFSEVAGGQVVCMASANDSIRVSQLKRMERAALQGMLNQAEQGTPNLEFPLCQECKGVGTHLDFCSLKKDVL